MQIVPHQSRLVERQFYRNTVLMSCRQNAHAVSIFLMMLQRIRDVAR